MILLTVKIAISLYKQLYRDPSNRDQVSENHLRHSLKVASNSIRIDKQVRVKRRTLMHLTPEVRPSF